MTKKLSYKDMGLDKKDVKLLNDYFEAFSNYYGVISLRLAFEIINEQNERKFPDKTLMQFAERKKHGHHFYKIMRPSEMYDDITESEPLDDEIVNESLYAVDIEDYYCLKDAQEGKPLYVPKKDELMNYADCSTLYYEHNHATRALARFLKKEATLANDSVNIDEIVGEFVLGRRIEIEIGLPELDNILRFLVPPEDEDEAAEFINKMLPLVQDVCNNTRIWINRGYTPYELSTLMGGIRPENFNLN